MEPPPILNPPVNRRRWWIHLLLMLAYILVVGLSAWGRQPAHGPALSHTVGGLLRVCVVQWLFFGLFLGLACLASRATRDDLRLRWQGTYEPVLFGLGYSVALRLAVGLMMFGVAIVLVLGRVMTPDALKDFATAHRPDLDAMVDMSVISHNPAYYWLTLTVVSFVVAGLREELWRATFLAGMQTLWPRYFGSRGGQMGAVLIIACFFGLAHVAMGGLAMVMAGLLGVGLGLIMVFHRSIWPAVIAHGMFDATTFALLPWVAGHVK